MEQEDIREKILQGYERLAFGSTADAVRLLFVEDISRQALRNMDLFAVAEIRRPKNGGMEIKFFDRIQAQQCMEAMGGSDSSAGFYEALQDAALRLKDDAPKEEEAT